MKRKQHRAVLFNCGGVRAVLFRLNSLNLPDILLLPMTAVTPGLWNRSFWGSTVHRLNFLLDSCSLVLKARKSGRDEEGLSPCLVMFTFRRERAFLCLIRNWGCLEVTTTVPSS